MQISLKKLNKLKKKQEVFQKRVKWMIKKYQKSHPELNIKQNEQEGDTTTTTPSETL